MDTDEMVYWDEEDEALRTIEYYVDLERRQRKELEELFRDDYDEEDEEDDDEYFD